MSPAASVIAPALVKLSESAVLVPVISVAESSLIETAPALLNVSEPKFVVSAASSPSVMLVPSRVALVATVSDVLAASVMAPALVNTSELGVRPRQIRSRVFGDRDRPRAVERQRTKVRGVPGGVTEGDRGPAERCVVRHRQRSSRRVGDRPGAGQGKGIRRVCSSEIRRRVLADRHPPRC